MASGARTSQQLDEVETVKAAFLARAHGDLHAAYEMLALNSVAVIREFEDLVGRHVSHGFVRSGLAADAASAEEAPHAIGA